MKTCIGSIQYINSLPVDFALAHQRIPNEYQFIKGYPQDLNQRILNGDIPVSPISTLHYAENQDQLVLLPNLSISSESGVKSVLLMSRVRIQDLSQEEIIISNQGKTTPALMRILLEKKWGIQSVFKTHPFVWQDVVNRNEAKAYVVMGDDALLAYEASDDWYVYDLAEEWRSWTARPFVFAVWVANRAWAHDHADELQQVTRDLCSSRQWGLENIDAIVTEARKHIALSNRFLALYYQKLRFDLDEDLLDGMQYYFEQAQSLGLITHCPNFSHDFVEIGEGIGGKEHV